MEKEENKLKKGIWFWLTIRRGAKQRERGETKQGMKDNMYKEDRNKGGKELS